MRRAAVLLLAAAALAGCGADEEPARERPAATAPAGDTGVTVEVRPAGQGGPVRRRTVGCDDARVCRRLEEADLSATPGEVACTQVFGGEATARVTGRVEGRPVDARFSLVNGCEIARWERLAWLLGPPPG